MAGGTGANPFIGQIIMVGFTFAPPGWAFCNGQLIAISENETLFELIGTTYGGDGQQTFALPDLRGRVPIHSGQGQGLSNYVIGEVFGAETVPLTVNELPQHQHLYAPGASQSEPTSDRPDGNYPAVGGYYAGDDEQQHAHARADASLRPAATRSTTTSSRTSASTSSSRCSGSSRAGASDRRRAAPGRRGGRAVPASPLRVDAA